MIIRYLGFLLITFFFPFINWLIPKTYVKITKNDYETLNIVHPIDLFLTGLTIFNFS
ncbi:DUF443 domain-containing protein [Staphylococcus aureus]|uniref:DUF443 domain-containing protein n=1 Tax=Staphylococcus aureus TaxID=1280 RepID=UPI0021E046DD|nr:DUF443 domain-containing protein [Staphylococcus aureus]